MGKIFIFKSGQPEAGGEVNATLGVSSMTPGAWWSSFASQDAETVQLETEPNGRLEASHSDVEGEIYTNAHWTAFLRKRPEDFINKSICQQLSTVVL